MFRQMRRIKQVLSEEESRNILLRGTSGVLAVYGDDGYPYAVPLSYVYSSENGDHIYFHCARSGHKIDSIIRNSKVSFCVIDEDKVVPEEFTTYFRSVIVFGTASIINDETEKLDALKALAARYTPDDEAGRNEEAEKELKNLNMIRLDIDHISGKEAIEFVRAKEKKQQEEEGKQQ